MAHDDGEPDSFYDSEISAARRARHHARRRQLQGATDAELGAHAGAVRDLVAYSEALEREVADLDALYTLTVVHATAIENELMRRNEEVGAFLANTSHELRTPLNAITGYAELCVEVAEEHGLDELRGDVDKIRLAATHLRELITDVLDISRIEAGRLELCIEPVDLADLIRTVTVTCEPLAGVRANALEVRVDPDLGVVKSDARRLRQCLINLIGNACKFTDHGRVEVVARRDGGGVVVEVVDDGIGMSEEHLARLFQPFSQADATISHRFGGSGLGLALSKRLVEAMGGDITVASALGRGSTFTVRLP